MAEAFGFLHACKQPDAAVAVRHDGMLPSCRAHGRPVRAVLTGNGREFRHDAWLVRDHRERPHLGCRNQGRRPWDAVERLVGQEGHEDTWAILPCAAGHFVHLVVEKEGQRPVPIPAKIRSALARIRVER